MIPRIRLWLRGAWAALAAMTLYAVCVAAFVALTLLVISLEEGGGNLSESTAGLASAVILLSQGSGFVSDNLRLTVTPLLLTVMLVLLIRALIIRLRAYGWGCWLCGIVAWVGFTLLLARGASVTLVDAPELIALKAAMVFTAGRLTAAHIPLVGARRIARMLIGEAAPAWERTARLGAAVALCVLTGCLCAGTVTAIIWMIRYGHGVGALYALTGMGIGSRILTTIASAAWLPNLCIWGISWLAGPGFAIGELARFTMWIGESSELPPVPAFGMLPEPVTSSTLRMLLIALPMVLSLAVGLAAMCARQAFGIVSHVLDGHPFASAHTVRVMLEPAVAFVLAGALIALGSAAMFSISSGSLGSERLRDVGVDVRDATGAFGHATTLGLMTAWLVVMLGVACHSGLRWLVDRGTTAGRPQASETSKEN